MAYSSKWLQFCKAEDEYFTCRYSLMQNEEEMVRDLEEALVKANDRETALRLLFEMKPEATVVAPLLSKIVDIAIDSSNLNAIQLARHVLYIYKDELYIRGNIQTSVAKYFTANDEWHYRRITELYILLNYKEEFTGLMALCRASDNPEIQEIADDFQQ